MSVHVSTIMLGVQDLARARRFYADGPGCKIDPDSRQEVDETIHNVVAAGGSVVKEAAEAEWGGTQV